MGTKAAVSKDEKIPVADNKEVESAISEEKVCPAENAVDKVSLKDDKSSAVEKQQNDEVSLKNEKAERKEEQHSSVETKTIEDENEDKPQDDKKSKVTETTEHKEIVQARSDDIKEEVDIKEQHVLIEECMVQETKRIETQSSQKGESKFMPGVLEITVQKASELVNKDMIGKSDPYVKIKFGDQEFKSRKERNTLEPEWNFSANLIVTSSGENSDIVIEVFDDDFGKENFIGSYKFSIKHAIKETHKGAVWYNLVGCKSGKIFFSTIYSPDEEPGKKSTKDEEGDKSYFQKDSKDVKEEPGKHDSFITDIQDSDGKQEEKNSSQEKDESEEKMKGLEKASEQNDTASSKDEKVCSSEELVEKVSLKNEKIIATEKEEEKPTIDKNKKMETAVNVAVDKVKEDKTITDEEVSLKRE